jgi:hypothetical protein
MAVARRRLSMVEPRFVTAGNHTGACTYDGKSLRQVKDAVKYALRAAFLVYRFVQVAK